MLYRFCSSDMSHFAHESTASRGERSTPITRRVDIDDCVSSKRGRREATRTIEALSFRRGRRSRRPGSESDRQLTKQLSYLQRQLGCAVVAEVGLCIAFGRVSVSLLGKDERAVPDCVNELRVELDAARQVPDRGARLTMWRGERECRQQSAGRPLGVPPARRYLAMLRGKRRPRSSFRRC